MPGDGEEDEHGQEADGVVGVLGCVADITDRRRPEGGDDFGQEHAAVNGEVVRGPPLMACPPGEEHSERAQEQKTRRRTHGEWSMSVAGADARISEDSTGRVWYELPCVAGGTQGHLEHAECLVVEDL
jgi:hypothetical protein